MEHRQRTTIERHSWPDIALRVVVDGRERRHVARLDREAVDSVLLSAREAAGDEQKARVRAPTQACEGPVEQASREELPDAALGAAERRDELNGDGVEIGPSQERDVPPVRRPRRPAIIPRVRRQTQRRARPDRLYVDVEVVLVLAVPRKRELIAVR